jgi:hypothetical protein
MELQIKMAEENDAPAVETLLSKSFAEFKSVIQKRLLMQLQ